MKLLISVCHKAGKFIDSTGLLHADINTGIVRYLEFNSIPFAMSNTTYGKKYINHAMITATGLTYHNRSPMATITSTLPPSLVIIDIECKKLIDVWNVVCPDPHSILSYNNDLYVVGSGSNNLYKFDLDKCVRGPWNEDPHAPCSKHSSIFYSESNEDTDVVHLNSAAVYQDDIYISAFGKRKDEFWRSADEGYIRNIKTGEKVAQVYHPHSLVTRENSIYFCESCKSSVRNLKGEELILPELGYTRGLAFKDDLMFVGTSQGRKVSKSTGIINNPADPGAIAGNCDIYIYRVGTTLNESKLLNKLDLSPWANEIFDILILD